RQDDRIDIVQPTNPIDVVDLAEVTVSGVALGEQDLRFHVDQVGVPVLVRISYFPNWQASGAEGPYRIAPNLMVVIPTAQDVHLTYQRSGLDIGAYVLTLIGIALLFLWRWLGDVRHAAPVPTSRRDRDGELDDDLPLGDDWRDPVWRDAAWDETLAMGRGSGDLDVELESLIDPLLAPPEVGGSADAHG
ncbi:MAG: hypothetical protein FD127_4352, partial [Acidimicrobiaceae bacterium]